MNTNIKEMNRNDFMSFFRNDEKLNLLSPNDREEIFSYILIGSSDLTKDLINSVLKDYCVSTLKVIDI